MSKKFTIKKKEDKIKPSIKLLSAGELERGQLVTCYEYIINATIKKASRNQFSGIFEAEISDFDCANLEEGEKSIIRRVPYIAGFPLKIIDVALPMVLCQNLLETSRTNFINPELIMDTRICKFIEISPEYVRNYLSYQKKLIGLGISLVKAVVPRTNSGQPLEELIKQIIKNEDGTTTFGLE